MRLGIVAAVVVAAAVEVVVVVVSHLAADYGTVSEKRKKN